MHGNIPFGVASATEISRQESRVPDKIVGPFKFASVARVLWPLKTAAALAAIAKRDQRTAERWLSGEFEPPYVIVEAVMHETFKRG
jgi:hypothetical protein